jgi:hypothetical protein
MSDPVTGVGGGAGPETLRVISRLVFYQKRSELFAIMKFGSFFALNGSHVNDET